MKERPIIFNTEMVRAILDGKKTQTRRIVNPQPEKDRGIWQFKWGAGTSENTMPVIPYHKTESMCPYGKTGDLLWVRETWKSVGFNVGENKLYTGFKTDAGSDFFHEAIMPEGYKLFMQNKWKPSIHMPKAVARIWLKVVDVRLERLWEISQQDCEAEGLSFDHIALGDRRQAFVTLWDSIHGTESWNANPWVWVIEFRYLPF